MSVGDVLADDEPAGIHAVCYRGRLLSYQAQQYGVEQQQRQDLLSIEHNPLLRCV